MQNRPPKTQTEKKLLFEDNGVCRTFWHTIATSMAQTNLNHGSFVGVNSENSFKWARLSGKAFFASYALVGVDYGFWHLIAPSQQKRAKREIRF
jgi:hypothetical protein